MAPEFIGPTIALTASAVHRASINRRTQSCSISTCAGGLNPIYSRGHTYTSCAALLLSLFAASIGTWRQRGSLHKPQPTHTSLSTF